MMLMRSDARLDDRQLLIWSIPLCFSFQNEGGPDHALHTVEHTQSRSDDFLFSPDRRKNGELEFKTKK